MVNALLQDSKDQEDQNRHSVVEPEGEVEERVVCVEPPGVPLLGLDLVEEHLPVAQVPVAHGHGTDGCILQELQGSGVVGRDRAAGPRGRRRESGGAHA